MKELLERLKEHDLELIGFVGGTLQDRKDFLGAYKKPYLYLDRLPQDEAEAALKEGYKLTFFTAGKVTRFLSGVGRNGDWWTPTL